MAVDFGRQAVEVRAGSVAWSLGLTALGRGDVLTAEPAVSPTAHANRVLYARPGLREWYANGPMGLEQGFTLTARPAGTGALALELGALPSSLRPTLSADRRSVELSRRDRLLIRYTGLFASDARGRPLPAWIAISGGRLSLHVNDRGASYPVRVDPFVQVAKLTASDGAGSDNLGWSVAVSGDTIAAGARYANVGGHTAQGAVYVFVKPASGWSNATETAKLTASDGAANDSLGWSVAISGDTVVAGAPYKNLGTNFGQGATYVFVKPANGWGQGTPTQAELTASDGVANDNFGFSVAIDGANAVVGAIQSNGGAGAAYVFVKPTTGWADGHETAKLTASDGAANNEFGYSVGISGDTVVAGGGGAVYTFVRPANGWGTATAAQAKLTASSGSAIGSSVAISGNTIAAGAPSAGGSSQGSIYVFVKPVTGWANGHETAELSPSDAAANDELGLSVAISGNTIVAGAPQISATPGAGKAYVFAMPAGGWGSAAPAQTEMTASDGAAGDQLGQGVAIDGGTVVAGAPQATISGNIAQGAAYVFAGAGSTTATVNCAPSSVTVGQTTTCTGIVSNNTTGGTDPSGSLTFTTSAVGSFGSGGACTLVGSGTGSARCGVTYTPSTVGSGSHTISAAYSGDSSHDPSSGSTSVTVTVTGSGGGGSGGGSGGGGNQAPLIARIALLGNSRVMSGALELTAAGSTSGATITDYTWSVATGGSTNSFNCGGVPNMSFAGNVAGTYQVAVTATNSLGATSTASSVISFPAGLLPHRRAATVASIGTGPGAWAVSCSTDVLPTSPRCITAFQFGIVDAVSKSNACFSITEQPLNPTWAAHDASVSQLGQIPRDVYSQYTATIDGPVGLNGLYLPFPAGHQSTLRTAGLNDAGSIDFGSVSVGVGGYSLLHVGLTQTLTAYTYSDTQEIGSFSVGSGGSLFAGLPFSGGMSLTLAYQKAIIGAQVSLPSLLSVVGGPATLSGTLTVANSAPDSFAFHANFSEIDLGFMTVTNATVDYDQALGELKIGGNIIIGDDSGGVIMTPIPPNGIIFEGGAFKEGGATFTFPTALEPEVFPGINIHSISAELGVNPTVLEGGIGLDVLHLAEVDGKVLIAFPSQAAPFTLTSGWLPPIQGTSLDGHQFTNSPLIGVSAEVDVSVPVITTLRLFSGYLVYNAPGYLWLGGRVDFNVLDGFLNWGGGVNGAFNEQTGAFDVEGYVYGSIEDWVGINIHAVVSSQGAGGCGDVAGVVVGGGVQWNGGNPQPYTWLGQCIFDRFTEDHVFGAADAAAALRPFRIHLRRGAPTQDIRLEGQGNAPSVRVTGPGGLTLSSPSTDTVVHTGSHLAIGRQQSLNMTEIGLINPRAGTYTITPLAGSAPITSVATALAPPPARMTARVAGTGLRRTLIYNVRRRQAQTVSVFEVNSAGMWRQIGTIHGGGRGHLGFTATPDRGMQRIVAQFTLHGIPVPGERMTVARFRPPPLRLPAPRRLRVRRTQAWLQVSWPAVAGAARYALAVRQPARGVLELLVTARRRTVRIPGLDPTTGGSVTVVALSPSFTHGRLAQVRFKALPKRPRSRKPKHRRKHR